MAGVDVRAGLTIVRQFHDVVKKRRRGTGGVLFRAPDMEDVHEAVVRPRDRLETRHPLELAVERTLVFKGVAVNDLHRPQRAGEASRQPDFAVRSASDDAQHLVVWNLRLVGRHGDPCRSLPESSPPNTLKKQRALSRFRYAPGDSRDLISFFISAETRCLAK